MYSSEKYYINPKTGLPIFVECDELTIQELYGLEFCTTQKDASDIMSARIDRICKLIQISWKEEERVKRWVGEAHPPAKVPQNLHVNLDQHVYVKDDGHD